MDLPCPFEACRGGSRGRGLILCACKVKTREMHIFGMFNAFCCGMYCTTSIGVQSTLFIVMHYEYHYLWREGASAPKAPSLDPTLGHGIVCSYVNCGVVLNFDDESIMHGYYVLE